MKVMPSQRGFYDIWVTRFWINDKWQLAVGFTETYWNTVDGCWQYHQKISIPVKTNAIGFEFSNKLSSLLGQKNVRGYNKYDDEYEFSPHSVEKLIDIFTLVFDSFPQKTFSKKVKAHTFALIAETV